MKSPTVVRIPIYLSYLTSLWLVFTFAPAPGSAQSRPNVLVILSDDQGWGDLSLNGNTNLATPHIDSLAKEGAQFDRFYVCPVCSPTRAEFLTGRYHPRGGVYSTSAGGERLDLDEVTIADTFRSAGYVTGAFGKWHNGMQYPYHPNGRGFDEFYGFCSGHWGDYFSPPLEHNGAIVQGEGFCIDDFTNHAIEFMKSAVDANKPFFAYLPLNTPHSPMQVPDRFWKKFQNHDLPMRHRDPKKENIGHSRAALAMCENIDWNVGRLLEQLDQWKISDNTIVLYFCDNGPNGSRWNGGMKGRKGSTDEGGVRSPLLVRWPASIEPGTEIKQISGAIDLLPTLADLCGVKVVGHNPLDGQSVARLLTEAPVDWPDRTIVSFWRGKISVRNQRFRYDATNDLLFDIEQDPEQRRSVTGQHPDVVQRLKTIAQAYLADVAAGHDEDDRPFLVGHRHYQFTQVPARDATATGGIVRSNRFPNCSYFTNWTSQDAQIKWDAEVGASGRYEVQLEYSCPAADVGSVIELSFGSAKLRYALTGAHDPPARGGEHDRVPRAESYVKDFKTVSLGEIELKQGETGLTLSALEMPGSQVMDFRLLMFIRK